MLPKTNIMFTTELKQFFSAFDISNDEDFFWRTYYLCTFYMGLRRSEAVRMNISDIDFHRKVCIFRGCKHGSDRIVPMVAELRYQLGMFISRFKAGILEAKGYLFFNKGRRIFHEGRNKEGKLIIVYHISAGNALNKFQHYCRKVGILCHYKLHSLRGAFATYMIERGVQPDTVRQILGHRCRLSIEPYVNISTVQKAKALAYAFGNDIPREIEPIICLCSDTPIAERVIEVTTCW